MARSALFSDVVVIIRLTGMCVQCAHGTENDYRVIKYNPIGEDFITV